MGWISLSPKGWLLVGLLVLAALLGTDVGRGLLGLRGQYEEYPYQVLRRDGAFELRAYAPALLATVAEAERAAGGERRPEDAAFLRLFRYISGKNSAAAEVSMTTPVTQEPRGEAIAMTVPVVGRSREAGTWLSFVMPARFTRETLPEPLDESIEIEEVPGQVVAVRRFSGVAYMDALERELPALETWMTQGGLVAAGTARLAFYDPPWTLPFLRRNEVWVPVEDPRAR